MVPPGDYRLRTVTGSGDQEITGIRDDPTSKDVLDLRTSSGDLRVIAG
jgi:hypothetical protein